MLVRWDPFEEMNRLHDHFLGGRGLAKQAFQVAVDIREEADAFYVDAEVPGLTADEVKVDVENKVLTLSGERKVEKEETEGSFRRVERQYGSFTRSFSLPETVDADHISADLKDGVLELRLPKKEAPNAAEDFSQGVKVTLAWIHAAASSSGGAALIAARASSGLVKNFVDQQPLFELVRGAGTRRWARAFRAGDATQRLLVA